MNRNGVSENGQNCHFSTYIKKKNLIFFLFMSEMLQEQVVVGNA